jgi:hypothetical protein
MVFYSSWYETAEKRGDAFRDKMINQIIRYGLYGEIPDNSDDDIANMMFEMAKPNIDTNIKKKIGGSKGGRKAAGTKKQITNGLTYGLSNADADANEDADADAYVNEDVASVSDSLGANRPEPIKAVDVSKLKGRSKQ